MSKIVKLLSLVSLLSHRHSVSFSTMQQVIGVPKRTLYRYLNHLSEANIPILYDKQSRGYRLAGSVGNTSELLNFNELLLTAVGLCMLRQQVNEQYGRSIDDLITKFTASSTVPLEEVLQIVDSSNLRGMVDREFSATMSRLLVSAAITCGRSLRVTQYRDDSSPYEVAIHKAKIIYEAGWQLDDVEQPMDDPIELNQFVKVAVD